MKIQESILKRESELEGLQTLKSLAELPSPTETAVSVITPPKVSYLRKIILDLVNN